MRNVLATVVLIILSAIPTSTAACIEGKFLLSINGKCPDGTAAVTNEETCQKEIKEVDNKKVTFWDRGPPGCKLMTEVAFGCYFMASRLKTRYNPLDKEIVCEGQTEPSKRVQAYHPDWPSICKCLPTTSTTTTTTTTTTTLAPTTVKTTRAAGAANTTVSNNNNDKVTTTTISTTTTTTTAAAV